MRTNRLISRKAASALDLHSRVALEAKVTDTIGAAIEPPTIPPNWTFDRYTLYRPWRKCMFQFLGPLAGKTILDLGCGYNPTPVYFALAGAERVFACDVSERAITYVKNLAREWNVQDRVVAHCCPAEQLPLEDELLDLAHGEAVLHHLELEAAGAELARVMKPGARAAFKDPLGHNALLEFARDYFPYRWKHSVKGTDCPLHFQDLGKFGKHFSRCEARGFALLSIVTVALFGRRTNGWQTMAHAADERLLKSVPWLQRFCRFVVTCVEK